MYKVGLLVDKVITSNTVSQLEKSQLLHNSGILTKPLNGIQKTYDCVSYIDDMGCTIGGYIPDNYLTVKKIFREAVRAYKTIFGERIPASPAHWEERAVLKPSYTILHLESHGKGQGTEAVKDVLRRSLADPKTEGRVTLHASMIDGESSPAGFYYKLGFRFTNVENNEILAKWMKNGGRKENAPNLSGFMYLPTENIKHCLNYNTGTKSLMFEA